MVFCLRQRSAGVRGFAVRDCVSVTYRLGGDVGQVGSDTGSVHNIVQGELVNERGEAQKKGERLRTSGQ